MDLEHRLRTALKYFGEHRDPRTIKPDHVRAWGEYLSKDGARKPGTVRHYLNALSGLYGRAIEGLYVKPGYNPVSALVEKPTGRWKGKAAFLEVGDAALLFEAARTRGDNQIPNAIRIEPTITTPTTKTRSQGIWGFNWGCPPEPR